MSDDDLSARLREASAEVNRAEVNRLAVAAEWDRRQAWANDGAYNGRCWLTHECTLSRGEALARASSKLSPWLVTSTSRQRATHQVPSQVMAAVKRMAAITRTLVMEAAGPGVAIGSAKHTATTMNPAHLHRLQHLRSLLATRGRDAKDAKLLAFSASGFDRALTDEARGRADVELIDLERLYRGR